MPSKPPAIRALKKLRRILGQRSLTCGADRLDGTYLSACRHIIVGGCGRSGTTLVRLLLDSHPNICCGPESKLFLPDRVAVTELSAVYKLDTAPIEMAHGVSESRTEFIDAFAGICSAAVGKTRWAEKTPKNILHLEYIFRAFPHSMFVHVLRDGRDVACSLRTHPRRRVENGIMVPLNTWNPIEVCIARWRDDVLASKPYWCHPRFYVVRYEDLIMQPALTMQSLLHFLGDEWEESLKSETATQSLFRDPLTFPQSREALNSITSDALGRWHRDLSEEDKHCFKRIAGELLIELGYAANNDW